MNPSVEAIWQKVNVIPGWFDEANITAFSNLKLPPAPVIVECGTYMGRSASVFYYLYPDAKIFTCDPHVTPTHLPISATFTLDSGKKMFDKFSLPPIDMLFIDDSHFYDDIKINFETYEPSVKSGGVIVFHDYHFQTSDVDGVRRFVDELETCVKDATGEFGLAIWTKP